MNSQILIKTFISGKLFSIVRSLPNKAGFKLIGVVLFFLFQLNRVFAESASSETLPSHALPNVELQFVENPTESDIKTLRVFPEPLLPHGNLLSRNASQSPLGINSEISDVLKAYAQRTAPDDFSELESYLARNPASPWAGSLWLNLGLEYYSTGWYSKALEAWKNAWSLLQNADDAATKVLGDRAAGELAFMYAQLGRMEELSELLKCLEAREIIGSVTEKIAGAKQGLWTMQNRPEIAFRCGPLALDRIRAAQNSQWAGHELIQNSASTTNGFSVQQLVELSAALKMNYQAAFRSSAAELVFPAVVHWKVGHYAALVGRNEEGLYHLQDPTFGSDVWVTREALEAESSGYFLIPPGKTPSGWRLVSADEAETIWGKGQTYNSDANATTNNDLKIKEDQQTKDQPTCKGMAVANAHLMVVSLSIKDTPISYAPPVGPQVAFQAVYNQREYGQPTTFFYSNLGYKWTFNWLSFITDNPSVASANVAIYADGGGTLEFQNFNSASQTFQPQVKNQSLLKRTSSTSYELLHPDGSKQIFALATPGVTSRRVFMTHVIDPAGNAVFIDYDANYRITKLTDAIGQITTFSYTHPNDPWKITKVTDPFGRFAQFQYESTGLMRLTNIIDQIDLSSSFQYNGSTDFIQAMTTPYGTSRFGWAEAGRTRVLELTDPNGDTERVEFIESSVVGIPNSWSTTTIPLGMFVRNWVGYARNTFYWDKRAYALAKNDYTKAKIYHWLHTANYADADGGLEWEKNALENPVWYNYPGQTNLFGANDDSATRPGTSSQPSKVGRVLDDGRTQLWQYGYNQLGRITNSVDPVGRRMTYIYSTNQIDLLQIRQTTGTNNEVVAKFRYNSQHLPIAVWDAAGQMTTNTYNARGQLLTTRNPLGQTTAFTYNTNAYLISINGPLPGTNDTTRFTYDSAGRVRTVTDTDGYTLTYSYDKLDRLTNIVYPDGTFESFTFNRLDKSRFRDRMGRETIHTHDALHRLVATQDPLNRVTRLEYCGCGGISGLIDPMGRRTSWDYDIQGRLSAKQYVDGSRVTYNYENATSRLKSVVDEKGQFKAYEYDLDDNRRRISYPNAEIPTATVTFKYDRNYNRMLSMKDGIGTTQWTYHKAGVPGALKAASVDGPWTDDTISFKYDALGRVTSRAINGVAETHRYDTVGRTTNVVNALGKFTYGYDGATARLMDVFYPNGQKTHYDYFDNAGDRRLQRIIHRKPDNALLSRFTYAYNRVGTITNWMQELGVLTETWNIGYDNADQLLSVAANQGGTNVVNYSYSYDAAGNRLREGISSEQRYFHYNALNELVSSSATNLTDTTFEWDAEQRLVAIVSGNRRSQFVYDGMGRRLRIVEKQSGNVQSDRRFVWCDLNICEERNAANAVVRRYFGFGEQQGAANLYYARDHLGSVRNLTDASSSVRAVNHYAPYGTRTRLAGNLQSDMGFTGHFLHSRSGLLLAPYRAYSPSSARWISRDLIGEADGPNIYSYVVSDPINRKDTLGFESYFTGLRMKVSFIVGGELSGGMLVDPRNGSVGFRLCLGAGYGLGGGAYYADQNVETGELSPGWSGSVAGEVSAEAAYLKGVGVSGEYGADIKYGADPTIKTCDKQSGSSRVSVKPGLNGSVGLRTGIGAHVGAQAKGCVVYAFKRSR